MTQMPKHPALALVLAMPMLAWAHPGDDHGGFLTGFLHPLLGVDHLLAMIAVGMWAVQLGGRAIWTVPAAFVAAMALGAALAANGIGLPLTEPMIAASVLLLGLLVGAKTRMPTSWGALLVGLFALSHGAAHVMEAPATASTLSYGFGFLLATALLHSAGIAAAWIARARPLALRVAAAPVALAGAWLLIARLQ